MKPADRKLRVLYSFPHKLGADRICHTAWQQVNGLADAGADVLAFPGVLYKPVRPAVRVQQTLVRFGVRLPYKLLGNARTLALHDFIVSRHLESLADQIDIVHCWPMAALRTLKVAARLGVPTVLERPNCYTRYVYEAVQRECDRLSLVLPSEHHDAFSEKVLIQEEKEYRLATRLLCPSDFVMKTFLDRGFSRQQLVRHHYGFDDKLFYPNPNGSINREGLQVLFVGLCSPKKGLHYALDAWLKSPAHLKGTFRIAGDFLPDYADKLAAMLSHPSVKVLGHRKDVPELLRQSDVLILPSVEEGSALVTSEARGSGCVLLVSDAAGAICTHMRDGLIHRVGDLEALTGHLTMLHEDRELLNRLRTESLKSTKDITWRAAGGSLLQVYRETVSSISRDAEKRV